MQSDQKNHHTEIATMGEAQRTIENQQNIITTLREENWQHLAMIDRLNHTIHNKDCQIETHFQQMELDLSISVVCSV
jgi:hypothetical protein